MGDVHGDMIRNIPGTFPAVFGGATTPTSADGIGGAFSATFIANEGSYSVSNASVNLLYSLAPSRVVPTGNANKPRAWGALACAYLGQPAL